ncbi:MAG: sulfotransferase [Phenylobacterium sp.]
MRRLVQAGRRGEANQALLDLEPGLAGNPRALQAAGEIFLANGRFPEALRVYRRAADLVPDAPGALYNLAAALVAAGEMAEAEATFDRVIALDPSDADAFYNRSILRRWTADENHLAALEAAVARARSPAAEVALCYALAKELEDLGDHAASWSWLRRGADRRRSLLSYRVESDVRTMALLETVFSAEVMAQAPVADPAPGPIFVLGLPRSGTTLVDRILCAHSDVASLGEIPDLALAVVQAAGPAVDKDALVRQSVAGAGPALGEAYLRRIAGYGASAPFLIDKTPANYLYIGLIALSMPAARIVHVRRDPMNNGYALYKTLFRTGCPYAYDLSDLAEYIGAYRRLMDHWRRVLPGRMIEVDYEAIVADQEGESRRLVAAVGLDWQDRCLEFHANPAPAATASAAQVRRPIYRDSVQLWRRYEAQLEPLAGALRRQGVL